MPKTRKAANTPKAALIKGLAALQGIALADLARQSGVHPSVFYRVVRGERSSARIDRWVARKLGVGIETIRRVGERQE